MNVGSSHDTSLHHQDTAYKENDNAWNAESIGAVEDMKNLHFHDNLAPKALLAVVGIETAPPGVQRHIGKLKDKIASGKDREKLTSSTQHHSTNSHTKMNSKFIGKLCLPPPSRRSKRAFPQDKASEIPSVRIRNLTSYDMSTGDGSCQQEDTDREARTFTEQSPLTLELMSQDTLDTIPAKIMKSHHHQPSEAEPEVDTRDSSPIHKSLTTLLASNSIGLPPSNSETSTTSSLQHQRKKPRLTLSAYRRPEQTVRLTDCDASRLLENEYNLRAPGCQVIGHGAFSTVRSAIRINDGRKVAVKSISKYNALRSSGLRHGTKQMYEWEIMKQFRDNPHVLTLFDVFETNEEIHLVMELCQGGELFNAIKEKGSKRSSYRSRGRYTEPQAARITHQILQALVDLHSHKIVHRDIKPENILLSNCDESDIQVKLCDFGVARKTCDEYGTPTDGEYSPSIAGANFTTNSPPEACKGACGTASDVYSLGVTLYTILCGFPPVFCENKVVFPDAYWNDISDDAKALLRSMLHPDPHQRITASNALRNLWIRQQTMRVRHGSISANLELVCSRLCEDGVMFSPTRRRKRRRSSMALSPTKKASSRRMIPTSTLTISLAELYSEQRNIHLIDEDEEIATKHLVAPKIIC